MQIFHKLGSASVFLYEKTFQLINQATKKNEFNEKGRQ